MPRPSLPLAKLTCCFALLALPAMHAAAPTYDESLARGKALIEARDYTGAVQELKAAAAADESRPHAFVQLAVASYRADDLAAAEEYAKQGLARAPESEAPAIREMLTVIGDKRNFLRLEQAGNEAYGAGLMSKAADAYRQAYELFPNRGSVGLRAAGLYADNLNRLLDAAALWQRVAASDDAQSAGIAREELKRRDTELGSLATTQLAAARQSKDATRFARLAQAFPDNVDIRLEAAAAFAGKSDVPNTTKQLAAANKLGLKPAVVIQRAEFQNLLVSPQSSAAFASFVQDAYGEETVASLRAEKQRADVAAQQAKEKAARDAKDAADRAAKAEAARQAEAKRLAAERQAREEEAQRRRDEAAARAAQQRAQTYYPTPPPTPAIRRPANASAPGMR